MKRHPAVAATLALLLLFFSVGQATAQENLPRLVKKIQPAVVTIIAYDKQGKVIGQGSGFFINQDGLFLTNYHVLAGANRALVKTADGRRYPVERMVAEDKDGDLVLSAVEAPRGGLPSLKISGVLPEVGEKVAVVGSPFGLEQTLSDGVVSAVRRIPELGEILQITAPISPGSSGSPVVNMKGEVIGVATLQLVKGQNLNFAVPGHRVLALQQQATKTPVAPNPLPIVREKPRSPIEQPDSIIKGFLAEGEKFYEAENYEKAAETYKKAIRLRPDYAMGHFGLGKVYIGLRRYQESAEAFKQAIRLAPNDADGYVGLGLAHRLLGRNVEAAAAFTLATRRQPNDAGAHYCLGETYLSLGNRSEALEEYKILKKLAPKRATELFNLIYR